MNVKTVLICLYVFDIDRKHGHENLIVLGQKVNRKWQQCHFLLSPCKSWEDQGKCQLYIAAAEKKVLFIKCLFAAGAGGPTNQLIFPVRLSLAAPCGKNFLPKYGFLDKIDMYTYVQDCCLQVIWTEFNMSHTKFAKRRYTTSIPKLWCCNIKYTAQLKLSSCSYFGWHNLKPISTGTGTNLPAWNLEQV